MASPEHYPNDPQEPLHPPLGGDEAVPKSSVSQASILPDDTLPPFPDNRPIEPADESLAAISTGNLLSPPEDSEITGDTENPTSPKQFCWWRDLSENGQKFYRCLIHERGDVNELSDLAEMEGFNLETALDELRGLNLLDESSPSIIKLSRKKVR